MAKAKETVYYIRKGGKYYTLRGNRTAFQFSSYAAMRKAIKSTFRLKKKK